MFLGQYESSVDDKGRIILPAKLRESIDEARDGQGFYATIGPDGFILLCTPVEWKRRVDMLNQAPFAPERSRRFARIMAAMSEPTSTDKQGRLRLTQNLLDYANITRQVTVVGNFSVIEIYDRDRWRQQLKAESLKEYKNDAEQLYGMPGTEAK